MKRGIGILVVVLLLLTGCKSVPPEVTPEPPAFPVQEMDYNGLRILFVQSPKEVVSMQLFLKGGVTNFREGRQGVEWLALNTVCQGGSEQRDSVAVKAQLNDWGASFSATSTANYGKLSLTCFREDFRDAFALFMEVLEYPAFPSTTFEALRAQQQQRWDQGQENPWTLLDERGRKWAFESTHLSKQAGGTRKSLEKISLREARGYYKTMVAKDRVVLVVVGNVNQDVILDQLLDSFREMPEEGLAGDTTALPPVALHDLKTIENPGFTQYVQGVFPGPLSGTQDAVALEVALAVLDVRLREKLAESKGLSPDPRVTLYQGANTWGAIRFSCNNPNAAAEVALNEVQTLHRIGFDSLEVARAATALRLLWTLDSQGAERIAHRVGVAEVTVGYREGLQYPAQLAKMRAAVVTATFRQYCRNIHWTCMGDPALPRPAAFRLSLEE